MFSRTREENEPGTSFSGIAKSLPEESFVDHRPLLRRLGDDPTGDLSLNAETRWEAMAESPYTTPNDLFFVRNHAPTPRIDPLGWTLVVEGPGVERTLRLGYGDLLRLPQTTIVRALECAGNARVFFAEEQGREAPGTQWRLGAIGVAEWRGVALREVLERAGLRSGACEVMLEGLDAVRMRRPIPIGKALEEDTILAYAMNGDPLPADHGFPLRAVVPGWAAVASVKWLGRIFVSLQPLFSPWNTSRYVLTGGHYGRGRIPVTSQVTKSALELSWPAVLPRGRRTITGRAWSPGERVAKVEYSIDGKSWQQAALYGPNVEGAWARFRIPWEATPGRHEIRVRTTGESGRTQPETVPFNEQGYLYGAVVSHPVEVL
ncbi:sulfite oxidase [Rubrobacter calidifluminis]|uniref:sulfite oxidase n=1 Tax=Rubrobacter calidifluminis TaxID=1392640 RepID=UPI00235E1E3F|nr:sulfite oxidase [Rubrobacter calidifluminis]